MLRRIAETYNRGGVTLVEAGTGTGKSLAYLIPSAEWALRNAERTVISTNTINLQEQLDEKDLPLVRRLVGRGGRLGAREGQGELHLHSEGPVGGRVRPSTLSGRSGR